MNRDKSTKRDNLQQVFIQAHKDNKRLDNPFLTLQDKQRMAEEKAVKEQEQKQMKLFTKEFEENERKKQEKEDLKKWYANIEA